VIRGAAQRPSYISINNADVKIKDATSIWGVEAQTVGMICESTSLYRPPQHIRIGRQARTW